MSLDCNTFESTFTFITPEFPQQVNNFRAFETFVAFDSYWFLDINCKECCDLDEDFIYLCLHRCDTPNKSKKLTVDFTITLKAADAALDVSRRATSRTFDHSTSVSMQKFMRVDEIIAQRDIYLPLDELSIQCHMIKKTDIEDLRTETKCVKALIPQKTVHDDLLSGLLRLYNDEKFCDFKIRTSDRTFNVHKIILCARSAVFTAMFNNDTIETREGVIKITDLDSDTVGLMLKFMYSNEFEAENEEEVRDLYLAADKYEILPLKDRCCNWLKMSLNEANVCDTYVFADFHEDENLKAAVQNYIFVRAHKILKSNYWKEFMISNPRFASEITHRICLKYIDE